MTDRSRLAKLIGMLGAPSEGERANALAAADSELAAIGKSWLDIAAWAERAELGEVEREKLFARLVVDRLRAGLVAAWAMPDGGAAFVRDIVAKCESGAVTVPVAELTRAIELADEAQRRANPFGAGARRSA